jgi:hypothetical protein
MEISNRAPIRVIGVDIGIRNLSMCIIESQAGGGIHGSLLDKAHAALASSGRLEWKSAELCSANKNANRCSHVTMLDGLVSFLDCQIELFEWATHIVIEAQPAARMKMIAAGLYTYIRRLRGPHVTILFQPARRKLAWGAELAIYAPDVKQSTYSERKKGAVSLMTRLLVDSITHADKITLMNSMRKKDDAADSFLHALCFIASKTP